MAYQSPLCGVARQINPQITILSAPFKRMGLFQIGARSTFVTLPSQSLVVIAPVPYDEESAAIVGTKPVKFLIAPDFEHHMALKSWKDKYPDAKIIGVEGLRERKAPQGVHVDYEVKIKDKVHFPSEDGIEDAELSQAFQFVYVPQHVNKELVVYHIPTKTLIEADLLFNLPAHEQYSKSKVSYTSGLSKIFNRLHPDSWLHKKMISGIHGKPGGVDAIKAIYSLDFETIIPCHGEVITKDAKTQFGLLFKGFI